MIRVESITRLPANFAEFADEIASGLAALYGSAAALSYLETGPAAVNASLRHPSVTGCAVLDDEGAQAMLLGVLRDGLAHISFIHVLRRCEGQGLESHLVDWIVRRYRDSGVLGIVVETIPLCALKTDGVFEGLGFERIERMLMMVHLTSRGLASPGLRTSSPLTESDWPEAADVVVDAYQGHPGQRLHGEVRSREGALTFIASAAGGGFGRTRPAFIRGIRRDGQLAGVVFGCEAAPQVGFILQIAVARKWQGLGAGSILLREAAQCFREAAYARLALGVTADNPARRLYERFGFRTLRAVSAQVWWR